jgi:hypothetical protein
MATAPSPAPPADGETRGLWPLRCSNCGSAEDLMEVEVARGGVYRKAPPLCASCLGEAERIGYPAPTAGLGSRS